jgi:hypothetical protein
VRCANYHHLNVAWNARRETTRRYAHLREADFKEWSRFPTELLTERAVGG